LRSNPEREAKGWSMQQSAHISVLPDRAVARAAWFITGHEFQNRQ
jgi:hypothetical protein